MKGARKGNPTTMQSTPQYTLEPPPQYDDLPPRYDNPPPGTVTCWLDRDFDNSAAPSQATIQYSSRRRNPTGAKTPGTFTLRIPIERYATLDFVAAATRRELVDGRRPELRSAHLLLYPDYAAGTLVIVNGQDMLKYVVKPVQPWLDALLHLAHRVAAP